VTLYTGFAKHYPEGTPRRAYTERRCNMCRNWYPAQAALCPECKTRKPAFNKGLRVAMLNNNLNEAKERALRDA
jgi:RNA polymerase subunit RPABC4/transcription elongation factor Spt4